MDESKKVEITDDRDLGLIDKKEAKKTLTKEQQRTAGIRRMRELMKYAKAHGNPRDFVVVAKGNQVVDYERQLQINASFPEKIEKGAHVWMYDRNEKLEPVEVIEDQGEKLLITNGTSQTLVERNEVYPTGLPHKPTLIHKSRIRFLVGDKIGAMFWNPRLRMRARP